MRISDWSSDVCSSDLRAAVGRLAVDDALLHPFEQQRAGDFIIEILVKPGDEAANLGTAGGGAVDHRLALDRFLEVFGDRIAVDQQIGRASCRERVCQYVEISVVAESLKKKKITKK